MVSQNVRALEFVPKMDQDRRITGYLPVFLQKSIRGSALEMNSRETKSRWMEAIRTMPRLVKFSWQDDGGQPDVLEEILDEIFVPIFHLKKIEVVAHMAGFHNTAPRTVSKKLPVNIYHLLEVEVVL